MWFVSAKFPGSVRGPSGSQGGVSAPLLEVELYRTVLPPRQRAWQYASRRPLRRRARAYLIVRAVVRLADGVELGNGGCVVLASVDERFDLAGLVECTDQRKPFEAQAHKAQREPRQRRLLGGQGARQIDVGVDERLLRVVLLPLLGGGIGRERTPAGMASDAPPEGISVMAANAKANAWIKTEFGVRGRLSSQVFDDPARIEPSEMNMFARVSAMTEGRVSAKFSCS